ncbi:hypothetical protein Q9189_001368 [Teloschistes chrysophthalmus]
MSKYRPTLKNPQDRDNNIRYDQEDDCALQRPKKGFADRNPKQEETNGHFGQHERTKILDPLSVRVSAEFKELALIEEEFRSSEPTVEFNIVEAKTNHIAQLFHKFISKTAERTKFAQDSVLTWANNIVQSSHPSALTIQMRTTNLETTNSVVSVTRIVPMIIIVGALFSSPPGGGPTFSMIRTSFFFLGCVQEMQDERFQRRKSTVYDVEASTSRLEPMAHVPAPPFPHEIAATLVIASAARTAPMTRYGSRFS